MHPNVLELLSYFRTDHLPEHLRKISAPFGELAGAIADQLDGPEVTVCLRKLLEAKDCAVRAAVRARAGVVDNGGLLPPPGTFGPPGDSMGD